MKRIQLKLFLPLICVLGISACKEEGPAEYPSDHTQNKETWQPEWDSSYRPLLHKFSSTGCTPCAQFGLPLFDQVANAMGDSILPLITHFKYKDPFITESSQAIEEAWLNHYSSPQIWVNQNEVTLDLIRTGLPQAAEQCAALLRKECLASATIHTALNVQLNPAGRFDLNTGIRNSTNKKQSLNVEVYGHEDSIWASQSGVWPPPHHFHVNRGGYFGGMGKRIVLEPGAYWEQTMEYIPCSECTPNNMYFVMVVWEEYAPGRSRYVNGKIIRLQ